MIRIVACLTGNHDPTIVFTAIAICVASMLAAAFLPRGSLARTGAQRRRLVLAAAVIGGGAWSTHFVALLAYDPGLPTGYSIEPTLLSVAVAVAGSLAGLLLWSRAGDGRAWLRALGGAAIGLSIGAMHYLGMTAVDLPGRITYQLDLVAASLAVAALLGGAALANFRTDASPVHRLATAFLLSLTVASLHFTGMGAVEVWPDAGIALPDSALPRSLLAALVVAGTVILLIAGIAVLALEARIKLRAEKAEAGRLRELADAAFEALALLDPAGRVVDASSRLAVLTGQGRKSLLGQPFASLLREEGQVATGDMIRATLESGIPVELRRRDIDTAAGPRVVVALRDLRERLESESRIHYMAHHDALTGLGNRALLRQRLEEETGRARRAGTGFAVLCLDLDRFKPVNDVHGHAAGDELLRQVAGRIRDAVRNSDACARLGGDEFVIIQATPAQPSDARALAERLVATLSGPFDLGVAEVAISASIGVAFYPTDAHDPDGLLHAADIALYRVKESSRSGFAFFRAEMDRELRLRRALENDVRMALPRGELSIAWQPQADTGSGEVTGFETLLRWNHPVRGKVSPDIFIPVAEASGSILAIGNWVLRKACEEAVLWPRPLRVAVNVSAVQVQQPDFEAQVRRVLEETGLEPERLELELTETFLISETDLALRTLSALKVLGVQLSLDDFGTGYSSLGMLRTFPFDKIKLDRSFTSRITQDNQSGAIVSAILSLSQAMGLPVVAEGVETEAQRALLTASRCEGIQGYLIGYPQPIEAFDRLTGRRAAA
jgi:diguanylate cyclase (GGDEF)-like protein